VITKLAGGLPVRIPPNGTTLNSNFFYSPSFIYLDSTGNIYIIDSYYCSLFFIPIASISAFGLTMNANAIYTIAGCGVKTTSVYYTTYGSTVMPATSINTTNSTYNPGLLKPSFTFNNPSEIITDKTNNNVLICDNGANSIYALNYSNTSSSISYGTAVNAGCITNIIGTEGLTGGYSGDGYLARYCMLNQPISIKMDSKFNLFISDFGNSCIRFVPYTSGTYFNGLNATANYIYTIIGRNGNVINTYIPKPIKMGININDDILYIDNSSNLNVFTNSYKNNNNNYVKPMSVNGDSFYIYRVAGGNRIINSSTDGTLASDFLLNNPTSLVLDPSDNIIFCDTGNNKIRIIINTFGRGTFYGSTSSGTAGYIYTIASGLNNPFGIAIDPSGNIVFCDSGNNAIKLIPRITGNKVYYGSATTGTAGTVYTIASTGLNNPNAIAIDPSNNIIFCDSGNNAIKLIPRITGNIVYYGSATTGTAGTVYTIASTGLNNPSGIAIDPSGNIIFCDTGNNQIKFIPRITGNALYYGYTTYGTAGNIYNFAGTGANSYGTSDPNTLAATGVSLSKPIGIFIDPSGILYVSDTGNNVIRGMSRTNLQENGYTQIFYQFLHAGVMGTLFGKQSTNGNLPSNGASANTYNNANITVLFNNPRGLLIDSNKSIYICDSSNNAVSLIPYNKYEFSYYNNSKNTDFYDTNLYYFNNGINAFSQKNIYKNIVSNPYY
jgi:streptogramin lyase